MPTIVIRQTPNTDPVAFSVSRIDAYQDDPEPRAVPRPNDIFVADKPDRPLRRELRWYLEHFLDYPYAPATDRADETLAALKAWGQQAFNALFGGGPARDMYRQAITGPDDFKNLSLKIVASDPLVLAWPWEALCDPQHGYLAHHCHIDRQIQVDDPPELHPDLPTDRVNILMVTARPYEADVQYRAIARPLIDLIRDEGLPAEVTLLRPPTLDQLQKELQAKPGYYHVVHFDGHGGYGISNNDANPADTLNHDITPHQLRSAKGCLVFEKEDGSAHAVPAETIGTLLREHKIPAAVLNACQSATIDEHAEDAFASVAASLVRAGVRSVVAMAYSLYVSGAQRFLPDFYRELFNHGTFAPPVRGGRRAMLAKTARVCARGTYPLQDWLVPVLYQQQQGVNLDFVRKPSPPDGSNPEASEQEQQASDIFTQANLPHAADGFVGRDGAILAMERAWRRRPPVLLIHGLGGVGKTTLALQFVQWLRDTGGLPPGHHFFIPFQDIRSADTVINTIGSAVFGPDFIAHPLDARIEALAKALRENPFALVWDNFESAFGNPDFGQQPNLNDEDRAALLAFLEKLRGGRTKILLTSRGEEDAWLPQTLRFKIPLGGLRGEERWELCTEILRDLGQTPDREDPEFKALIDWLGGHPLLMRATLPRLESLSPSQLLDELKASLDALDVSGTQSEEVKKAHAALHAVEQSLAPELRPLLIPLGLHERYVDADYLEEMANMVGDEAPDRAAIDRLFAALTTAGLTHHLGHSIYGIHPLLTSQLRVQPMEDSGISQAAEPREVSPENYAWTRAFIEFMANYANHVAPKEHHEQRFAFTVHGTNFNHAHLLAESDATFDQLILLTNSLASFARKTHRYADAERLFDRLVSLCSQAGNHNGLAVAYFQLGTVAEDCGDFEAAEKWFRKSLAISEEYPSGYDAGKTYTRLGSIADERHDFDAAETWHRKSLAIYKKSGNEEGIATTYHYLGIVAQKRDDFEGAAKWYVKALEINERLGRDDDTAANCQHLGIAAQLGQNFEDAEQWYLKSIKIKIKLQNEEGLAKTYGQMGNLSLDRQNLEDAEVWYLKSLAITEKLNNKSVNAITFYQLGLVAKQRGDFDAAEKWFRKALPIFERLADSHTAEIVKRNLSRLAEEDRSQPTNREKLSDLRAEPDRTNAAPDPDAPSP